MFRTPAKRAMALVVTGAFALGAAPTLASTVNIPQSSSSTKRQETRLVSTPQTEEVRGEKQLVGTTPHVEEQVTGPASKLVTESEIRRYQVPVTTHPLRREESREITTTTTHGIRRTTSSVVMDSWPVWIYYRGHSTNGDSVNSIPRDHPASDYAKAKYKPSDPVMAPGSFQEFTAQQQSNRKAILVQVILKDAQHINMRLGFDTNLRFVAGYFEDNPSHGSSEVKKATVTTHPGYHQIEIEAVCNKHGNWFVQCGTNIKRTLRLYDYVVKTAIREDRQNVTRDEPYQTVSESAGPWTATGRMDRGPALTNPGLRYEPLIETVLLRRYQAMNDAVAPKQLATSGNDVRKTFSADKSSGKDQAVLSGSKMRQGLGANRVTPSRVAPKGAGAADKPGAQQGASGKSNAAPGHPQPTPKPGSISWWFPRDPQTPPPSVRYASYVSGL